MEIILLSAVLLKKILKLTIKHNPGGYGLMMSNTLTGSRKSPGNFKSAGNQPAQKWLKDRYGRKLGFEDIQHYQKIIIALTETDRIMKEIDKIDFM